MQLSDMRRAGEDVEAAHQALGLDFLTSVLHKSSDIKRLNSAKVGAQRLGVCKCFVAL